MSAYIVDHDHIDALLDYAIQQQVRYVVRETNSIVEIDAKNATEIGRILLTENERSVRARYPACDVNELPGTIGEDVGELQVQALAAAVAAAGADHPEGLRRLRLSGLRDRRL